MRLGKTFQPGDPVSTSGVYSVLHSTPHSLVEREMFFEGGRFPLCPSCPDGVTYRLESPCVSTRMPAFQYSLG
jgi:hypothetical protein